MFDSAMANKEDEIRGSIRKALVSLKICISIVLNTTATLSGKAFRPQKPSVQWVGVSSLSNQEHSVGKGDFITSYKLCLRDCPEMKATLR
jgi:hypothetical protein